MALLREPPVHPEVSGYIIVAVILAAVTFVYKLLNRTDIPKIKGLPELPGVPIFGSL